ncbi:hypothetical protein L3X38_036025 [Prunus dulcis]|uniref:Uncharacterized protein n=1 Tax=Prunus dulcis TaxID=3755 RepID=A0AAD4V1S9_PRUDU|nr:hypothetical protein L3X38_036025 [Prunus dulcis]
MEKHTWIARFGSQKHPNELHEISQENRPNFRVFRRMPAVPAAARLVILVHQDLIIAGVGVHEAEQLIGSKCLWAFRDFFGPQQIQDRGMAREGIEVTMDGGAVVGGSGGMWSFLWQGEGSEAVGLCSSSGSYVVWLLICYNYRTVRQSSSGY